VSGHGERWSRRDGGLGAGEVEIVGLRGAAY